ncbi:MAG TPA: tyrosine--tRNA ligase [Chloroflexota bacterium]|nr:tyrosine--tRNA ligase [Chloroflexota bacterium]
MTDVIDTLRERGFVQQVSNEAGLHAELEHGSLTVYCGYDPTAASLHLGHLVSIMMLAHFQRAGHVPLVVVGGGTGLIGDPTGKTETRRLLTEEEITTNIAGLRGQFERFIDFSHDRAFMLNNLDWLASLSYLGFLRDIGVHFSVNQLLQHSTYRERVTGEGLNFIELNYALLQAYDFLHLHRVWNCALQIGGVDQWFNILAGVDLIRRVTGDEAFAMVAPLILTSSGEKMGKTVGGAVWLDAERTPAYDYYQYWINTADQDVERFLALFTFLPMHEVRELGQLKGADLRTAKERLAFEATAIAHGHHAAHDAQSASHALFAGDGELDAAPSVAIPAATLQLGVALVDLLVQTGLVPSKRAARDLIRQGGAYVNGDRIASIDTMVDTSSLRAGAVVIRAGKKRFCRIVPV